jgi:hypothetical protein
LLLCQDVGGVEHKVYAWRVSKTTLCKGQ